METENTFDAEAMAIEYEKQKEEIANINKMLAYQKIADPIFFKWQAGEATEEQWLEARRQVKDLYPDS